MAGGANGPIVALFKATPAEESSDDRYFKVLKDGNYNGITIPTLAFRYELETLKESLLHPEKYSGFLF